MELTLGHIGKKPVSVEKGSTLTENTSTTKSLRGTLAFP